MNREVILQIFSGGFLGNAVPYKVIEDKLASVLPRFPVRKVIMGWSTGKDIYEKTASFLAKSGIELYFWLPVFSETSSIRELSPLVDFQGKPIEGGAGHSDENFAFCCPNNPQNIERILDIYESNFSSIPFNGIFLDKIRFPSFANGFLANELSTGDPSADGLLADGRAGSPGKSCVFSCFCPHCLALYEKLNIDAEKLKDALSRQYSAPMGIKKYMGSGIYSFENETIQAFFSAKADIITRSLEQICRYFRAKNLGIAFDVFAPFLSPFVGQNLIELSKICDFMKPMMYRLTNAPAGLPYEVEALFRETGFRALSPVRSFSGNTTSIIPDLTSLDYTASELHRLALSSACPIYAGIEINRKKDIAEVYPPYIKETIRTYDRTGIHGFALSWNLLDAPEENVAIAAKTISF